MHFQLNKVAAAVALSLVAGGAQAAISNDAAQTGNGEVFLSFLHDTTTPTSLVVDTGIDTQAMVNNPLAFDNFTVSGAALTSFFNGKLASDTKFNGGGVQRGPDVPSFGFLVTTNDSTYATADLAHIDGLQQNTAAYINNVNDADSVIATNNVTGPYSPGNNAFHDNIFVWSNNVGGVGPDTEGGVSNSLDFWRFHLNSDFSATEKTKLGNWTVDFTNASATFHAVGGGVSPVPVPAAVWLLASALVGFAGVSRRRAE